MLFNNRSITMNFKQYFTINYWLNRIVLVFKEPPPTYSESAPSGAVELGLRQHPPTIISYMKACQCPSSLGDLSRLGTNPDISNLYTTKNRKVTYL